MKLTQIREVALTVTAVGGAIGVLAAGSHYAGPQATLAVGSGIGAVVVVGAALAVRRWAQRIEYHLAPNGHESELPEALRDLPLRALVGRGIALCLREVEAVRAELHHHEQSPGREVVAVPSEGE